MTVSANSSLNYTRDQLITAAYRLSGLWPSNQSSADSQSAYDVAMAADFMNLELQELQAEGILLRTSERTLLTLTAGTAEYSLDVDTIDIDTGPNDQAGSIVPTDGSETLVTLMTQAEYLDLADKGTTTRARPTRVFVDRGGAVMTVIFWPAPDTTSVSWRYARVRLLKDMDSGGVTVDLARRWLKYVTYAVAAQVGSAKNLPLDRVNWLYAEAMRLKEICKDDDNERVKTRFRLAHNGVRWR